MKHNSHSWIRFFLVLFVFLIPVCFSDWIYLSKTATVEAGTKDSDMVTVTVHTRQQSNEVVESQPVVSDRTEDTSIARFVDSSLTQIAGFWGNDYKKNSWVGSPELVDVTSEFSTNGLVETVISYYKQKKVVEEPNRELVNAIKNQYRWTYKVAWFKWTSTTTKSRKEPTDLDSSLKLRVKKGETIKPIELAVDNYQLYDFYTDTTYKTLFDFSKPIMMNTDIYLKYYQGNSTLTDYINGKTKGSYSIYDSSRGSSGGNFNVTF